MPARASSLPRAPIAANDREPAAESYDGRKPHKKGPARVLDSTAGQSALGLGGKN
jgi:hypothetical protein